MISAEEFALLGVDSINSLIELRSLAIVLVIWISYSSR
jgi:hypothetical protein